MPSLETEKSARTNILAYHLFRERGGTHGDDRSDWYLAEWALGKLLPYVALEAAVDSDKLIEDISANLGRAGLAKPGAITLLAVLDGAPEFSRECYRRARRLSRTNGLDPKAWVEQKDREFYRICCDALSLYGARILQKELSGRGREASDGGYPPKRRLYQDTCVGAVLPRNLPSEDEKQSGNESLCRAIAATLHLCHTLKRHNEEHNLAWTEQLHARVVIASSVASGISSLKYAWRDEIVVDPESSRMLSPENKRLLRAAGVRLGSPAQ